MGFKLKPIRKNRLMGQRKNKAIYDIHLIRKKETSFVVDDVVPNLPVENVMQSGRAYNDMRRIQKITFENRFLIEKINRIYRLGGWIDHRNPYAGCRVSKLPALMKKLRQFEYENLEMLLRILKTNSLYPTWEYLQRWETKDLKTIRSTCRYDLNLKCLQPSLRRFKEIPFAEPLLEEINPRIFLKFKVGKQSIGRVIFKLFTKEAPQTCRHFLDFLQSQTHTPIPSGTHLNVRWIFSHTYLRFDGPKIGRDKVKRLSKERGQNQNNVIGTLSAIPNYDRKSIDFIITFRPLVELDKMAIVIGKLLAGFDVIEHIRHFGHQYTGRPSKPVNLSSWGSIGSIKLPMYQNCYHRC